jgi:hypothetical protein
MSNERCVKWNIVPNIEAPCANISFAYDAPDRLRVLMRFSNVRGGIDRDLELIFHDAIGLRWQIESLRVDIEQCELQSLTGKWMRWAYPLLKIENSAWLQRFHSQNPVAVDQREHFFLVSMNDLVQVLALPNVDVSWIEPLADG